MGSSEAKRAVSKEYAVNNIYASLKTIYNKGVREIFFVPEIYKLLLAASGLIQHYQ